jgi:DNA helicase-2/ATP-dependent DNA helicase PcrA
LGFTNAMTFERNSHINKIANILVKPNMAELVGRLSDEQLIYILYDLNQSSYLKACPGSGKTEVIGVKVAYEISRWNDVNSGIAILSFTRSAAKEVRDRISIFSNTFIDFPHFVGTFDSWLHGYLLHPFSHIITKWKGDDQDKSIRIISSDSEGFFLDHYKSDIYRKNNSGQPQFISTIPINEFYLTVNSKNEVKVETTSNLLESVFKSLTVEEVKLLVKNKEKFFEAGFATYQDCEYLATKILNENEEITKRLTNRFKAIIIDECQDLSYSQLVILNFLVEKGANIHLIGDMNQAIYEFRKVAPDNTLKFITHRKLHSLQLTNNFRSNQNIVNISQSIINATESIIGIEPFIHQTNCLLWEYSDNELHLLPLVFEKFLIKHKFALEKCVILSRGKSVIKNMKLHITEIPRTPTELIATAIELFFIQDKKHSDLENSLIYMGKSISYLAFGGKGNISSYYCPDKIKPSEWRSFLAEFLQELSPIRVHSNGNAGTTWSNWAKTLKASFEVIWGNSKYSNISNFNDFKAKIKAPSKKGNIAIPLINLNKGKTSKIKLTTIHDVKGETYHAVLLVSSPDKQSKGGHFEHWFYPENELNEFKRFAYVACSRPKHILVLATPSVKAEHRKKINEMGFVSDEHKKYLAEE